MSSFIKNQDKKIQKTRFTIQVLFALLCIWIGVEFHFFVNGLEKGASDNIVTRPPGVDGFLPISSLMNFYYFISTGNIHPYHPAGVFILLAIIGISFVFAKSFCSWFCPVGLLSELIGDFGEKLFRKKIKIHRLFDIPLRSLKYLILGFFVYAIFFVMDVVAIKVFLDTPYNLMSDIKMYYFFAEISRFSLIVISILFLLSIVIRNFWCRYLCPYGALLGIVGLISPFKIKRNSNSCIDCSLCSKVCPSRIKVAESKSIISDECTSCLQCVDACPVKDTLVLKPVFAKSKIEKFKVSFGVIILFVAITGFGMLTGNWQNDIDISVYKKNIKDVKFLGHPKGTRELKELNYEASKTNQDKNQR